MSDNGMPQESLTDVPACPCIVGASLQVWEWAGVHDGDNKDEAPPDLILTSPLGAHDS